MFRPIKNVLKMNIRRKKALAKNFCLGAAPKIRLAITRKISRKLPAVFFQAHSPKDAKKRRISSLCAFNELTPLFKK